LHQGTVSSSCATAAPGDGALPRETAPRSRSDWRAAWPAPALAARVIQQKVGERDALPSSSVPARSRFPATSSAGAAEPDAALHRHINTSGEFVWWCSESICPPDLHDVLWQDVPQPNYVRVEKGLPVCFLNCLKAALANPSPCCHRKVRNGPCFGWSVLPASSQTSLLSPVCSRLRHPSS